MNLKQATQTDNQTLRIWHNVLVHKSHVQMMATKWSHGLLTSTFSISDLLSGCNHGNNTLFMKLYNIYISVFLNSHIRTINCSGDRLIFNVNWAVLRLYWWCDQVYKHWAFVLQHAISDHSFPNKIRCHSHNTYVIYCHSDSRTAQSFKHLCYLLERLKRINLRLSSITVKIFVLHIEKDNSRMKTS